jgi:ubiquinone/menaquinone biosynthesis C-methylase UbiE
MAEQIKKQIPGQPVTELAKALTGERNASGSQVHGEQQASGYEDDPEHTLFSQERQVWLAAVDALGLSPHARVLDLGAGTGALLAALKAQGLAAVGLEPSAIMIEQGLVLHPELKATDFKHGDASAMTSEDGMFDLIVSR